jgi:ABC-type sulfate transport system permease subunit
MLHIKQVVDIMIDEGANDDRGAILLDPDGWMTFIRETGLPPDSSDQVCYRGVVVTTAERLAA